MTASGEAARRLGYGLDPRTEWLGDAEALLSREEWSEADRAAARATLDRAKTLPWRTPESEQESTSEPTTASERAARFLRGMN